MARAVSSFLTPSLLPAPFSPSHSFLFSLPCEAQGPEQTAIRNRSEKEQYTLQNTPCLNLSWIFKIRLTKTLQVVRKWKKTKQKKKFTLINSPSVSQFLPLPSSLCYRLFLLHLLFSAPHPYSYCLLPLSYHYNPLLLNCFHTYWGKPWDASLRIYHGERDFKTFVKCRSSLPAAGTWKKDHIIVYLISCPPTSLTGSLCYILLTFIVECFTNIFVYM